MVIINFKNSRQVYGKQREIKPVDEVISYVRKYSMDKKPSVREFYSYSFVNKDECKKLFIEFFLKTNLTFKNFRNSL